VRTLTAPAQATLGSRLGLAQLIAMDLTSPVFVTDVRDNIEWNGDTYLGGRQVGLDPIRDQGGEVVGMSFQLSGVPSDYLAVALAEAIQGKAVRVYTCLMDPDDLSILDVIQVWAGTLDQMPISQGPETATITVTAEHRGITFARPKGIRYTDGDQQRAYPGDLALEFIVAQSSHQDTWPSAVYFKK
jgi:hypothetical protein